MNEIDLKIEAARARRVQMRREGMTLIEIMIVIGIIAMIAGGVGFALLPQFEKAKIKTARTDAQVVRSGIIMYVSDNGQGCPTVDDLVEGRYLDGTKKTVDPWNTPFIINCDSGDITVGSAGPDAQAGTEDDIN